MYFSKYYNSERFSADKMHTRAVVSSTNPDYRPPGDIQLFYILEIIEDLSALGQTQFKIFHSHIDNEVINKLEELGYHINQSNLDCSLVINWRI